MHKFYAVQSHISSISVSAIMEYMNGKSLQLLIVATDQHFEKELVMSSQNLMVLLYNYGSGCTGLLF